MSRYAKHRGARDVSTSGVISVKKGAFYYRSDMPLELYVWVNSALNRANPGVQSDGVLPFLNQHSMVDEGPPKGGGGEERELAIGPPLLSVFLYSSVLCRIFSQFFVIFLLVIN